MCVPALLLCFPHFKDLLESCARKKARRKARRSTRDTLRLTRGASQSEMVCTRRKKQERQSNKEPRSNRVMRCFHRKNLHGDGPSRHVQPLVRQSQDLQTRHSHNFQFYKQNTRSRLANKTCRLVAGAVGSSLTPVAPDREALLAASHHGPDTLTVSKELLTTAAKQC